MVPIITGVIGIITAAIIVLLIRRDHLHVRYGFWWMIAAAVFALLGVVPWVFDEVAGYLGISYPPVLALILGVIVLLIKILVMDLERSRNQIRLTRLVQRIALLEADVRQLQGRQAETPKPHEKEELVD
jgi:hypothetical protein